jgi:hypothetical protein
LQKRKRGQSFTLTQGKSKAAEHNPGDANYAVAAELNGHYHHQQEKTTKLKHSEFTGISKTSRFPRYI